MGIVRMFVKKFYDLPVRFGKVDSYTQVDTDGSITQVGVPAAKAFTAVNTVDIQYAPSATTDGIEALFQVVTPAGLPVAGRHTLNIWVSDDEFGDGLTGTSASGNLTVVWGTTLIVHTAKKHLMINTDGTGLAKLLLVDSVNTAGERFCCTNPVNGKIVVGAATIETDYEGGVIPE